MQTVVALPPEHPQATGPGRKVSQSPCTVRKGWAAEGQLKMSKHAPSHQGCASRMQHPLCGASGREEPDLASSPRPKALWTQCLGLVPSIRQKSCSDLNGTLNIKIGKLGQKNS